MSKIVVPKMVSGRWNEVKQDFGPDTPKQVVGPLDAGVWIECEVESPQSQVGRTVLVRFPPEICDTMLRLFKDYAIARRSEPERSQVV